ncbi:MAG: pilus assembly protein PilM [Candidatus Omnitrophica bacterium]|nr:pilus assembly protein PilM [Candidatus Omnitrophota bacterium]MDD5238600.1 pilus assembly protein PilM [Candidatus Omnitrophota bacterium]
MSVLAVYFGPQTISIAESKGKTLLKQIQIPTSSTIPAAEAEESASQEVKTTALFKDLLRRNNIQAKEAVVCLSGKDLIIRNFEIPPLPKEELARAVMFEIKKFIPFKVEDLVSDFQVELDKRSRTNQVLFIGIKKEILNKYLYLFKQLNLKVSAIEYSAFSAFRSLNLTGANSRGVIGLVNADIKGGDEVNFTVLENGFPLFSRDITLAAAGAAEAEEADSGMALEKLKTEIRISLDYYYRKFTTKKIQKIFFLSDLQFFTDIEAFMKELSLSSQLIDFTKITGKQAPYSLSLIKGYCASLNKAIKSGLKVNLLAVSQKEIVQKEMGAQLEVGSLLEGIRLDYRAVVFGLLICAAVYGYTFYHKQQFQEEINKILRLRPEVTTVDPNLSYDELTNRESEYQRKLNNLDKLIKNQLYATKPLDIIPRLMPEGMWLRDFSFSNQEEDRIELNLEGVIYLGDSNKELTAVNSFISNLKENQEFSGYFKDINIVSVENETSGKLNMTRFSISCRTYRPRREEN